MTFRFRLQFIAIIGTVSVEIALVSRFWTRIFAAAWSLSYVLTFPWLIIIPLVGIEATAQSRLLLLQS